MNEQMNISSFLFPKFKITKPKCYDMGFRDGIDFALKVIGDERLKGKVLSEYGKSKNL